MSWNNGLLSDDDLDDGGSGRRHRTPRSLPPEVLSLLGQANVSFAQGRREEALKMVEEVVRQRKRLVETNRESSLNRVFIADPNYHETYDVLSTFHGVMGHKDQQLQFGLLAAHLYGGTDGEKWVELAELALDLGDQDQAIRCYTKGTNYA